MPQLKCLCGNEEFKIVADKRDTSIGIFCGNCNKIYFTLNNNEIIPQEDIGLTEADIVEHLEALVKQGTVKEEYDPKTGELKYKLSNKNKKCKKG